VDVDGRGRIIEEKRGTVDHRNRYQHFGKFSFTYDANGNCVCKESSNPGFCLYTYDQDNRLIKSECYNVNGQIRQTIEYFYDALGRQVRKVVTDEDGVTTDYTYVWAGSLLIEEYENGKLARTYFYGIGATPAQMSSHRNGRTDFSYIVNGGGRVSGLLPKNDPNAFAEKYGYEVTGAHFMKEIQGVKVELPQRPAAISKLSNSILFGDFGNNFGSVMADWANGTLAGFSGGHLNADMATALNMVSALGGHKGVKTALGEQMRGILAMLGLGGSASAPAASGKGTGPGFRLNPKDSPYAAGSGSAGPSSGSPGRDPGAGIVRDTVLPIAAVALVTVAKALVLGGGMMGTTHNRPPDTGTADKAAADKAAADKAAADKAAADKAAADKAAADKKDDDDKTYVDPDYVESTPVLSPGQIETKLNERKHPVNPDGGGDPLQVDMISPPLNHTGIDPTRAYFDGEVTTDRVGLPLKITTAPMRHVRDWDQGTPEFDPTRGEGTYTNTGGLWPPA
jgi:hypothetical protein